MLSLLSLESTYFLPVNVRCFVSRVSVNSPWLHYGQPAIALPAYRVKEVRAFFKLSHLTMSVTVPLESLDDVIEKIRNYFTIQVVFIDRLILITLCGDLIIRSR